MPKDRTDNLQNLRLYTLTEIEDVLGVTHRTLLQWIKDGKLPGAVKMGGKWKISEGNLKKFLEAKEV